MSTYTQTLCYLRTNYINAKNDYFRFLNTYNKHFWSTLPYKIYNIITKNNIRLMIRLNKLFINLQKNKIITNITSTSPTNTTITTSPTHTITPHTTHSITNTIQSTINSNYPAKKLSCIHTNTSSATTTNSKNTEINHISLHKDIQKIITNTHILIKNLNIKGEWCYFKKSIYILYNSLTSHYSTLHKNKFKSMSKKGLQQDIILLLDIYKQNYDSYKSLFNNSSDKTTLLTNPEQHPLITNIIKSYTDKSYAKSFISIINSTF